MNEKIKCGKVGIEVEGVVETYNIVNGKYTIDISNVKLKTKHQDFKLEQMRLNIE